MGTRHADRIWMIAGATVIVLLAVASWLLLISPKYAEKDEVEGQTEDTQTQLVTLSKRINELKKKQAVITTLQAALDKKQTALPADSGVPAFLNQLQKAGSDTDVSVTGVAVGAPAQQANLSAVWALPITLTADGSTADLERFLTTLQTGQARAVLIEAANLTPKSDSGTADDSASADTSADKMSISLSLKAFVAPPAGAGAPSVTK
jgi:type IV pilus assembly protein PilO